MAFYTGHISQNHKTNDFTFLPLKPKYTELDYDALMNSKSMLRDWGGGTWPRDDFTLDENRVDLQQHWEEFEAGEAHAYTILNSEETRCEGCYYSEQLTRFLQRFDVRDQIKKPVSEDDVLVDFWIREERLDEEAKLLDVIINWLKSDWEFSRIYFLTNNNNDRQSKLFRAVGMQKHDEWTRKNVTWVMYLMA